MERRGCKDRRRHRFDEPGPGRSFLFPAGSSPPFAIGGGTEHSGDFNPAGLDFPLVDLDPQQARQVLSKFPARIQGPSRRIAVVVPRPGIGPVPKQQPGDLRTSQERGSRAGAYPRPLCGR